MRAPAVSFAKRFVAAFMAALLTFALVPASALAEGEGDSADAPAEELQEVGSEQVDKDSGSIPVASSTDGGTLASVLVGIPTAFINSDVALDSEPVVGSFTVDGLTFAVTEGSDVELVGVSSDWQQVAELQEGEGSPVAPMLASGLDGLAGDSSTLALPESIAYEGVDYAATSIGAYAFYLSGVTSVELPVSVGSVDDRAFRSSDVASVSVTDGNVTYSSRDGALYDAAQLSLLLIPEGKQGTVLLPKTAEVAPPSVFSHCSLVQAIAVEEGSAAFASENGLLYDASLTTLLRVPAGATDITIHDGCTTIAAGALEACASLATITASASVASISPDVFTSVPTVSLPVATLAENVPQITALVALSSTADDLPEVDPGAITVFVPEGSDGQAWEAAGFSALCHPGAAALGEDREDAAPIATLEVAATRAATAPVGTAKYDPGAGHFVNQQWTADEKTLVNETIGAAGAIAGDASSIGFSIASDGYRVYKGGLYHYYAWAEYNGIKNIGWSKSETFSPVLAVGYTLQSQDYIYAVYPSKTVTLDRQGATTGTLSITARVAYAMPSITVPTRAGYTFQGYYTATNGGGTQYYNANGTSARIWDTTSVTTLYAYWTKNAIQTVNIRLNAGDTTTNYMTVYLWYGKGWYDISNPTDSTAQLTTIGTPERLGYTFVGTNSTSTSTTNGYSMQSASTFPSVTYYGTAAASGTYNRYVIWTPVVAADVPIEVTARVDLLGIEEQEEAQGYIESRCGEPLTVADVAFKPLSGAAELFGAASVADVALEVLAAGSTSPDARFALDASATQAPASAAAFRMASYGTRVSISYRFAIPDELLPSLVEATKPVCAVAYTVALASQEGSA